MKKIFVAIFFILLLSGCTAMPADREIVEDSVVSAGVWSEEAKEIMLDLPAEAELMFETQEQSFYTVNNGELEIATIRFLCSDTASAVRRLTGFDLDDLNFVEKNSELGKELFVTWCAAGEEGSRVCSADIVTDGIYAYSVICSFTEDTKQRYDEEIRDIFSGFGLLDKNIV